MAKLRDELTWVDFEARARAFLGVASGSDDDLEDIFDAAKRAGDRYMNNFFTDGEDLPRSVLRGVLVWMNAAWTEHLSGVQPGTNNMKTGDLSQGWTGPRFEGYNPDAVTWGLVRRCWAPFRQRWDL